MAEILAGIGIGRELLRRKIEKKFKDAGAVSEENAKFPEELGVEKKTMEKFKGWKRLKRTEDGRYYLCEK